jgi:hypothetical protein
MSAGELDADGVGHEFGVQVIVLLLLVPAKLFNLLLDVFQVLANSADKPPSGSKTLGQSHNMLLGSVQVNKKFQQDRVFFWMVCSFFLGGRGLV